MEVNWEGCWWMVSVAVAVSYTSSLAVISSSLPANLAFFRLSRYCTSVISDATWSSQTVFSFHGRRASVFHGYWSCSSVTSLNLRRGAYIGIWNGPMNDTRGYFRYRFLFGLTSVWFFENLAHTWSNLSHKTGTHSGWCWYTVPGTHCDGWWMILGTCMSMSVCRSLYCVFGLKDTMFGIQTWTWFSLTWI